MFNTEEAKELRNMFFDVWNYIGSDLYAMADESGEPLDNEEVIEALLDADRLEDMAAHTDAQIKLLARFRKCAYDEKIKFVKQNCGLFV